MSKKSGKKAFILWMFSIMLMFSAYAYQKRTGPTRPYLGNYKVVEKEYQYKLLRTEESIKDAIITLDAANYKPSLFYKRFKTNDEFTQVLMKEEDKQFKASLPKQPAAGKLEYYLVIKLDDNKKIRIPEKIDENIIIRFKDPVPFFVLIPHIIMMFFSMLFGMRAALGAFVADAKARMYMWIAFLGMTVGGMVLGPIVQKYAFGEYWTGFPWGGDWTDNKMLIMWLAWLSAVAVVGLKEKKKEAFGRAMIIIAAIVMIAVYTIPHSMGGSELDYSQVDAGVDPKKAIKTGS